MSKVIKKTKTIKRQTCATTSKPRNQKTSYSLSPTFFFKPNFNFHETQACNETDFDPQTSKFNSSDTRPTPTSGLSNSWNPTVIKKKRMLLIKIQKSSCFRLLLFLICSSSVQAGFLVKSYLRVCNISILRTSSEVGIVIWPWSWDFLPMMCRHFLIDDSQQITIFRNIEQSSHVTSSAQHIEVI